MKVCELFSGIGAPRKALINIGANFETVAISEIDKFAIQSYGLLYGETPNLGDITKIDMELFPSCDLLVYGFPCQDVSMAGRQAGLDEGSNTRSSLLWNCFYFIKKVKPKYLLLENVRNLVGATHKKNFEKYLAQLSELGYNSTWAILNTNHFELPQNRERVFCLSVLGEEPPKLPMGIMTEKSIRSICEGNPEEKYYMDKPFIPITPTYNPQSGLIQVGNIDMKANDATKRVYSKDGMCPTLTTMGGGHREPKILEDDGRVRKLTPRECWKLMGFTDEDFEKVSKLSNTQLYKQAGNSIGVSVLEEIFRLIV